MRVLPSLRARLLVAFLLPTLVLFGVAGTVGYGLTRRILEEELGRSLSRVAASAAANLSAERLLTIEPEDDVTGTRTYKNFARELEAVRTGAGLRRVFAVDASGRVRVDVGGGLPVGAEMPELARDRLEIATVREGKPSWSQVLFEGSDGVLYKTGYAPLSGDGQVVAIVGVEGTSEFFGPLRRLYVSFAALVAIGLVVLALLALLTARGLTAPLNRLMAAATRIGGGDLETAVPPERTVEIGVLARELEAMRQALESRDRQLKMMLAGVAHEVRNPIGGMELFAGLLAEELPAQGDARSHVDRIRKEIDYLKRIVEDFLAFARERKLALERTDAGAVLKAAHDLMSAEAAAKQVELAVTVPTAAVLADESLLVSAVANLVKNAIQATPPGGKVELSGEAKDGRVVIEVRDHGAGIAAELRERIFEPFFTTREKGTGLGLPLARKIAQAHHGELEVHSSPGQTVFRLELPQG